MNSQELKVINDTQDEYTNLLIKKIKTNIIKTINFSSPTGTGKTKMMADVISKLDDDFFFVITTLSRGQLKHQINSEIKKFTSKTNYLVYGLNEYTKNTHLQAEEIISLIPLTKKIIWFRDEGHINTNRWMEVLEQRCTNIINFSATNKYNSDDDIKCNFNHTMMLRTVIQSEGEPVDALQKLLEVKKQHKGVKNYNPCAIFRILDDNILKLTIQECQKRKLKYINITDDDYDMADICRDDNEYDVIINKFKITEGIDIRRAHVLYMTNEPSNPATTIQLIGRCRRNALLYRDDIDILNPENKELLEKTRTCYVYYNVQGMNIEKDENGDLVFAFCQLISVEDLKPNIEIKLENGILPNGLEIIEANKESGVFKVLKDEATGFNVLNPLTTYYADADISKYKFVEYCKSSRQYTKRLFLFSDLLEITNNNEWDVFPDSYYKKISFEEFKAMFLYEVKKTKANIKIEYDKARKKKPYRIAKYKFVLKTHSYKSNNSYMEYFLYAAKRDEAKQQLLIALKDFEKECSDLYYFWESNYQNGVFFEIYARNKPILSENSGNNYFHDDKNYLREERINKRKYLSGYKVFKEKEANNIISFSSKKEMQCFIEENKNLLLNDYEIATLSGDVRIQKRKNEYYWVEDTSVTSKISKYTKFNRYITLKFNDILQKASKYFYKRNNIIFETKKLNAMFGYCVEYTAKLLLLNSSHKDKVQLVRDAIELYQDQMKLVYGLPTTKIPSMSYNSLCNEVEFIEKIYVNALKVKEFIKDNFSVDIENIESRLNYLNSMKKCNLSVNHIYGLADFIIGDTILDLKCTNEINEKYIKQICAYYWLAKKHNYKEIENVMIYDVMAGRWIKIKIEAKEINANY